MDRMYLIISNNEETLVPVRDTTLTKNADSDVFNIWISSSHINSRLDFISKEALDNTWKSIIMQLMGDGKIITIKEYK